MENIIIETSGDVTSKEFIQSENVESTDCVDTNNLKGIFSKDTTLPGSFESQSYNSPKIPKQTTTKVNQKTKSNNFPKTLGFISDQLKKDRFNFFTAGFISVGGTVGGKIVEAISRLSGGLIMLILEDGTSTIVKTGTQE